MRASNSHKMFSLLAAGAALTTAAGCKWTEFDDLEDEAWVVSTGKPDNDSANWGVAVQRINRAGQGGKIAVIGTSEAVYAEVTADANGGTSTVNPFELNTNFSTGNLATEPLMIADPLGDEAALVTKASSGGFVIVLRAVGGQPTALQVFGANRPDAATYLVPPQIAAPTEPLATSQILLAEDDTVYGTFYTAAGTPNPPNPQPKCKLVDDAAAAFQVRALGAVRLAAGDEIDTVVAWSATGKLALYDARIFNGANAAGAGCDTGSAPISIADTTFATPVAGSQIHTFRANDVPYAVLQGHDDSGKGYLGLYNLATLAPVGSPLAEQTRVKTAALMELDGKRYVVAGYPTEVVDGVTSGLVRVFEIDLGTGIASTPALLLHDAEPEEDQAFGRGVTVMQFNNRPVIAATADNDVFVYFRTNLYGETRQGR